VPEVSDIRPNERSIIYSSENTDFRFLGAIQKPLNEIALYTSSTGGIPTRGLVLLFGYGGSPISVLISVADSFFVPILPYPGNIVTGHQTETKGLGQGGRDKPGSQHPCSPLVEAHNELR
jgi:hypothetical protein